MTAAAGLSAKSLTGIAGFDEVTGGGLPLGRTTLLVGGPGSGKTIFRHAKSPESSLPLKKLRSALWLTSGDSVGNSTS
jgi:hypothetical protein